MLALVGLLTAGSALASATIERVSFATRADGRGYVVRFHADGRIGAYAVEQPTAASIQFVVYNATLAGDLRRGEPVGPVRDYRAAVTGDHVTFTFDLAPGSGLDAQAYPDRDSNDLLLALTTLPASAPVAAVTWNSGAGGVSANGASPATAPSTALGDAASREHWRLDCVVVDAGHGGHDGGATYFGVREKDVTLAIARRLGTYLEDNLGMRVVYTRSDDRFIELHERGRSANASCGKLFISIHANAAGSSSARGTETYFLAPHRTESARNVMERENSVVRMETDPNLYADFDAEGGIMRQLAFSAYQQESQDLASLIEAELGQRARRHSRGVKQAGFLVLWRASMPAVLVETGFVTNPDEARFLSSSDGQDLIASAIFRAVRAYKEQYERGISVAVRG